MAAPRAVRSRNDMTRRSLPTSVMVLVEVVVAWGTLAGCVVHVPERPVGRESISIVSPRCAGARSCVLGHVTTTLDAAPIAQAAVFLLPEGEASQPAIQTLTDEQGVFTIIDPPPGSYRVEVFKEAAKVELAGLELGRAGTTMIPVRLALD